MINEKKNGYKIKKRDEKKMTEILFMCTNIPSYLVNYRILYRNTWEVIKSNFNDNNVNNTNL